MGLSPASRDAPLPGAPATSGPLPGQDHHVWVLAGANGSLHFVAADGTPIDQFNYGAMLTGVALLRDGDRTILVVASAASEDAQRIEAWQVTAPAVAEKRSEESESR